MSETRFDPDDTASLLPARVEDWPELDREAYEERAAIIEYEGRLPRARAEKGAEWCQRRRPCSRS